MNATGMLRTEHGMLRALLDALEAEVQMAPKAMGAIRVMCRSLIRMLNEHIRNEEDQLAPYARRLTPALRHRIVGEHADEWLTLHELDAIFTSGIKLSTGEIVDRLARIISELRTHMDEEEQDVFSAVDRMELRQAREAAEVELAGAGGA